MFDFSAGAAFGFLIACLAIWLDGGLAEPIKQQAFDRGHMVECVGKAGYYWECE